MAEASVHIDRGRRTENREVRRQQLIEATIASVAELGFTNTTLESVTKRAGLSHGTINFHFKSKEVLLTETLGYLAKEHFDLWRAAIAEANSAPSAQLAAIIEVDFQPPICSPQKLAVWFSFWGQARYRPTYLRIHAEFDQRRSLELRRLCAEIIHEGSYDGIDPVAASRSIEALVDGLWLNILLYPEENGLEAARDDAFDFLARLFPKHFP